eukprot:403339075
MQDQSVNSSQSYSLDKDENEANLDPNAQKKHYSVTSDDSRKRFIELWNSGTITIKQAAQACGINYSTAKSIVKLSKIEGRVEKKKKRVSKRMRKEKEELESLLHGSLKRQRLELPSLDRFGSDTQFLQQLGILPPKQDSKEKQLVEKACSNKLVGLTSQFLNFSQQIQSNLSCQEDKIIPQYSTQFNNSFLIEKEVQQQYQNGLSAIELRNLSLLQLQQFQEIIQVNSLTHNSLGGKVQATNPPVSEPQRLIQGNNILFEILMQKTLDENLGLMQKGSSCLHCLYV